MSGQQCENPLGLKAHYRNVYAYKKLENVSRNFFEKYLSVCNNLKEGMTICGKCKFKIESAYSSSDLPDHSEDLEHCCNPYKTENHLTGKNARKVTRNLVNRYSSQNVQLEIGRKICSNCRIILYRTYRNSAKSDGISRSEVSDPVDVVSEADFFQEFPMDLTVDGYRNELCLDKHSSDDEVLDLSHDDPPFNEHMEAMDSLNMCLISLNMDPISSVHGVNLVKKFNEANCKLKTLMPKLTTKTIKFPNTDCKDCENLISSSKQKFQDANRNTKYVMLTSMPKSMTQTAMRNTFGCGKKIVRKAVQLRKQFGPFSSPVYDKSRSLRISTDTKNLVREFYKNPEFSRALPSKRETIRVKVPGGKNYEIRGKQRMLLTVQELYHEFRERHPDIQISLSLFYLLRPKECIPVGRGVFHNTCTCIINENFDLMLIAIGMDIDLKYILHTVPCDQTSEECMMGLCNKCPLTNSLEDNFKHLDGAESIVYYQWIQTDGTEMAQKIEDIAEFKDRFYKMLPKVLKHHFLVRKQNFFIKNWRLQRSNHPTEALVNVDFAQNYAFLYQDEVQSSHWNHKQATVNPFYVEYTCADTGNLKTKEYIVISDDLKHNTVAFYSFQKQVMEKLKVDVPYLTKIRYVSDGSSAQYKNFRAILNVLNHEKDFGVPATLEYFPTAHGKGNCDRLSAVTKSVVRRDSVRKKKGVRPILTPCDMYDHLVAKNAYENRKYIFVTQENVRINYLSTLKSRFASGKTIPGSREFHSVTPLSSTSFEARRYSLQQNSSVIELNNTTKHNLHFNDFIAVRINDGIQIGEVFDVEHDNVTVVFFKQTEKNETITLTKPQYVVEHQVNPVDIYFVLSNVKPTTRSERFLTVSSQDYKKIKQTQKL